MAPEPVPRSTTDGRRRRRRQAAPAPARRPTRSRAGGSAPAGRRGGRACGTPSGRARTAAARRPAAARPCVEPAAVPVELGRGGRRAVRRPPRRSSGPRRARRPAQPPRRRQRCRQAVSHRLGEAAGLLVGDEGVADLVELAGQHPVELVEREPDAVVGDPVLLEVVGADLLAAPAAAGLAARGPRTPRPPARSCSSLSSRLRSTCRALALFWSWLFSSCIDTTRPVGRWVMRTAESVVLTDCPPGPDDR